MSEKVLSDVQAAPRMCVYFKYTDWMRRRNFERGININIKLRIIYENQWKFKNGKYRLYRNRERKDSKQWTWLMIKEWT